MMIPGANLLSVALRVIQPQTLGWQAWTGRTQSAAGDYVTTRAASVEIQGSMQPVEKKLYQQLGLDLAKNYSFLYTSADVKPVARDRAGDLVTYNGQSWEVESDTNWRAADGWRKLLCVEVPSA